MIEAGIMAAMVKATRPGVRARKAILRELRRRERATLAPPTYAELQMLIGAGPSSVALHLRTLISAGLVIRDGTGLHLTDAGRIAAE